MADDFSEFMKENASGDVSYDEVALDPRYENIVKTLVEGNFPSVITIPRLDFLRKKSNLMKYMRKNFIHALEQLDAEITKDDTEIGNG